MTERELRKVADEYGVDFVAFITDWWKRHPGVEAQDMVCIVAASFVVIQREFTQWLKATEGQNNGHTD